MPVDGGFASATANTDMAMPTAITRTANAIAAFAQILDSSVVSANQALSDSTPTPVLGSRQANEAVASIASPGTGRKAIKFHQAADSSAPASSDGLPSRSAAISNPTNNVALLPVVVSAPANVATIAADLPFDASGEISEHPQTLDSQRLTSSATPHTADALSSEWNPEATQTAGARLQAAGALPELATSTRPSAAHAEHVNGAVTTSTVWTGAERFVPFASAAPSMARGTELAASAKSGALVSDDLPARTASDGTSLATINAPIGNNAAVEPPQQPLDLTPSQRTEVPQHAEPTLASKSAMAPANRLVSNAPISSFTADQTITSSRPARNFSSMFVLAPQTPARPLAKASPSFDYAAQENIGSLPNFAGRSTTTEPQGEKTAIADLPAGNAFHVSTVPKPIAASQVRESASAIWPNPLATRADASFPALILQAGSDANVAQTASPKQILTAQTWASVNAEESAPKSQPVQTDNSLPAAVQVNSLVSNLNISLPQVERSAPHSAVQETTQHQHEPPTQDARSNDKTESPLESRSSALQASPTSHMSIPTSPKIPGVNMRVPLMRPISADAEIENSTLSHEAEAPDSLPLDSNVASWKQCIADAQTGAWTDAAAHKTPATVGATSDTQSQADSHISRAGADAPNASTESVAPASNFGDAPAAMQAVSAVEIASKTDVTASASVAAATDPATASNNSPVSSAVLARPSAEKVELSAALQAWNGGDNAQTRLIQTATLGGNLRASEMNIALQAGTLGPVELHAKVAGDVVAASIGVERHDAHAMIASELPALHQALNDRELRVGDLSVFQGSVHSGGTSEDGRPSQHRETASQRSAAPEWATEQSSALSEIAAFSEGHDTGTPFDANGRLSVRA